jgi:hypothetical protein
MTPQIQYLRLAGWIDRLRWRLCVWLCPAMTAARGKRELEDLARECGASKAVATRIASTFFRRLHHDR